MEAVLYRGFGGPEVLCMEELPRPVPRDHELLVRVRATSVNPVDWKLRQGRGRPFVRLSLPMVPGEDVAGEVVEAGAQVSRFTPGEAVFALLEPQRGGAAAQYAAVSERSAARLPASLSPEEAAALPLAALSALQALRDRGRVEAGSRVLVYGAAGGVGHLAVQIARALGGRVTAVAREPRLEALRELAEEVVDREHEDFRDRDTGWDVIFDAVGRLSFREVMGSLTPRGRYVTTLAGPSGGVEWLGTRLLGLVGYRKRAELLRVRPRGTDLTYLGGLVEQGQLTPWIHATYDLADLADAHRQSEAGHVHGKIVVRVP